ncbi:hypothetical protein C8J56DRAFT_1164106 [Mycena floridula]|nr:hypothetical protein C8J56DRAFT_1164106 [Mycena floridula]
MSVHKFPVPSVPDSPFNGVIDTNYAPDDSELDQIRALTVAPLLEIEKLDLEISRLQKARDSLQSFVSSHHALLSPIRRLVPEILQQIFVACLPTDYNAIMHKSQPPVLLTRICRRWREIAMKTAELWTSIHITIPLDKSAKEYNIALSQGVGSWIARTGTLPIDLTVLTDTHVPFHYHSSVERHKSDNVDFAPAVVTHLARYSSQWRSMHLAVSLSAKSTLCLEGLRSEDVPMLEKFVYTALRMNLAPVKVTRLSFLREAPALKTLVITDTMFCVRMHLVPQSKHPGEEKNGEDSIAGGQKGRVRHA